MTTILKKFIKQGIFFSKEIWFFFEWLSMRIFYFVKTVKLSTIGEEVYIFGNGPSLQEGIKNIDFSQKTLLVVNFFPLNKELFFRLKPLYCLLSDPVFSNHSKNLKVIELLNVLEQVNWDIYLISLTHSNIEINNKFIRYVKLNNYLIKGEPLNYKFNLMNKNIATFGYQNVINCALYFLISSRVKKIYLIGVDNDWHRELYIDQNNHIIRKTNHFYGSEDLNVTLLGEVKNGEFYLYMYYYYLTLYKYYLARKYADFNKCVIINLNEKSYIDVFEKKNISTI